MIKNIILIACLIIISNCDKDFYIPMEKDSKYGADVCSYYDEGHYYVKPCEKGKYCADNLANGISNLEICYDLPNPSQLSNLNEGKCKTSFECDGELLCNGNTCTECPNTNEFRYGDFPYRNCISNTVKGSGYCSSVSLTASNRHDTKISTPESYKKCGKLTIKEYPNTATENFNGIYYIALDEYTYIGTVQDGEYVSDMELCESGFALPFYYGGLYDDPISPSATADTTQAEFRNRPYLRCVTPISVNQRSTNNYCSITYKINDGDSLNYNVDKIASSYTKINEFCSSSTKDLIRIKYDHFREYSKSITEDERKTCGDLEITNKYTCENNGLIKSWYFYKNPEKFILYNGREKLEKVLNYLIQKEYPSYSLSKFLNNKIIFLLILFLL